MMPQAPCKECKDRILGCHSTCKKYLSYRKELNNYNAMVKNEKLLEKALTESKMYRKGHL